MVKFVGTPVLTTALRAAGEMRLTRMDLPFLLGTAVTVDRTRAKAAGYLMHFLNGEVFAFAYYAVFIAIGMAGWWLGALFGFLHGLFAGTALISPSPAAHPAPDGHPAHQRPRGGPAGTPRLPDAQLRTEHARDHRPRPRRLRSHRQRLHHARCLTAGPAGTGVADDGARSVTVPPP
ncbi:hypothetical protein [Streptomyces sp. NPDC051310]|uniref:hypothetical protein n=1 Tax=Streptomyces sp. NPDC051310 TaxID=3365649 RepID=UPI0037B5733B